MAQIAAMHKDVQIVARNSTPPAPPSEPPRSSIRVAAKETAKWTARATKIGSIVLTASVFLAEWVASHYPHMVGPLGSLFRIALRLLDTAP